MPDESGVLPVESNSSERKSETMSETVRDTVILGSGCAGLTAAHLHGPRQPEAAGAGGPRAWRPALDHHAGGEFSGLAGGHSGAGTD